MSSLNALCLAHCGPNDVGAGVVEVVFRRADPRLTGTGIILLWLLKEHSDDGRDMIAG